MIDFHRTFSWAKRTVRIRGREGIVARIAVFASIRLVHFSWDATSKVNCDFTYDCEGKVFLRVVEDCLNGLGGSRRRVHCEIRKVKQSCVEKGRIIASVGYCISGDEYEAFERGKFHSVAVVVE